MSLEPKIVNNMAETCSIDDFGRWKVDILRKFCHDRGLAVSNYKRKDELVALAFAAYVQKSPIVVGKEREKVDASRQYSGFAYSAERKSTTRSVRIIVWLAF